VLAEAVFEADAGVGKERRKDSCMERVACGRIIWVKYYGRCQHRNGRRFARLARKAEEGVGTLGTCSGTVGTLDQHDE